MEVYPDLRGAEYGAVQQNVRRKHSFLSSIAPSRVLAGVGIIVAGDVPPNHPALL